jgi:uncharacterized NAD(P)/FAD-binding protein YdhS
MVDVALELNGHNPAAQIIARSRHGLLPLGYGTTPILRWNVHVERASTARALLRDVRAAVELGESENMNWRSVVASVRRQAPELWRALPPNERQRLARHALRYWEIHRHRMAPEVEQSMTDLMRRGALQVGTGRINAIDVSDKGNIVVGLTGPRGHELLDVTGVVNCTGPAGNYGGSSFVQRLIDAKLAVPDELQLGLLADSEGRLISARGEPAGPLYAIGWLRRGEILETTAVPELRRQINSLASHLVTCDRVVPAVDDAESRRRGAA